MESESVLVYTGLQNTRSPHEKEPLAIEIHEQVSRTTVSMLTSSPVSSPQRAWGCGDEAKCMCMYYNNAGGPWSRVPYPVLSKLCGHQ